MPMEKPRKRAVGGGRKEVDHTVRLREMAAIVIDRGCSPYQAAKRVADCVIGLGDQYDWGDCPRVRLVDSLVKRLTQQWSRAGRGDGLLADERKRRLVRQTWQDRESLRAFHTANAASLNRALCAATSPEADFLTQRGLSDLWSVRRAYCRATSNRGTIRWVR